MRDSALDQPKEWGSMESVIVIHLESGMITWRNSGAGEWDKEILLFGEEHEDLEPC